MNRKAILFVAASAVMAGIGVPAATFAGPPANQACVGESLAALATNQLAPGGFGHAVVGFAQAPDARPGLGDGIHALMHGFVLDDVVPNTCND